MNSILEYVGRHRFILAFALFGFFFLNMGVSSNSKVYADCGSQGSVHDYAGAIIDVRAKPWGQPAREANNAVYITTNSPTYSGGNIVRLGGGPEGVSQRISAGQFNQISNNCVNGFGSTSVVLGYGVTSNGGNWALDCDISIRPASAGLQAFNVTGVGVPSGLRAATAAQQADGYGWTTATIRPINGGTSYTAVIYNEPPPNTQTTTSYEWELNMRGTSNCVDLRGSARLIWLRNDGIRQNIVPEYRIIWLSPNGPVAISSWQRTGILGATDRNDANSFRYQLNFGAALGAQIWGSTGGFRDFRLEARHVGTGQSANETFSVYAKDCSNQPANFSITARCDRIDVSGMNDPDRANVQYGFDVYELGPNGERGGVVLGLQGGTGLGNFSIPLNLSEQNRVNNGFQIVMYVVDVFGSGTEVPGGRVERVVNTGKCYDGNCSVNAVAMTVPNPSGGTLPLGPGGVVAGQQYTINYVVNDTGQLRVPQGALSLTEPARGAFNMTNSGETRSITYTAPNTPQAVTHTYYPDYAGLFGIGPTCQVTVYPHVPFNIEPQAVDLTLLPDNERPTSIRFRSSTNKTLPPGYSVPNVTAQRVIRKNINQDFFNQTSAPYRAGDPSDLREFTDTPTNLPQPRALGDTYCAFITVRPAQGWLGPNDRTVITVAEASDGTARCNPAVCIPNPSDPGCGTVQKVVNQPYVKVYGGDVAAGGGFIQPNGSCTVSQTSVRAFMRPLSEGLGGSGTQLGVFAWGSGQVSGFASANQRTNPPAATSGNGLTFANNVTPPNNSREPLLGGQLGSTAPCLPDYFDTQYPDGSDVKLNGIEGIPIDSNDDLPQNKQTIYEGADLTIAGLPNYDRRHTLYVEGDAIIRGNIIYNESGYGSAATIPNFTLVVKGNIYIDKSVNRIDGTFIAQPTVPGDTNSGRIYTCTEGDAPVQAPDRLYALCGAGGGGVDRLRVNGSLIADRVIFGRTMNTISDSVAREANDGNNKAAEIITFNPEVYLSPPVFRPKSTVTSGDYEYIATLPPVL